jgi:hypothetical protein
MRHVRVVDDVPERETGRNVGGLRDGGLEGPFVPEGVGPGERRCREIHLPTLLSSNIKDLATSIKQDVKFDRAL